MSKLILESDTGVKFSIKPESGLSADKEIIPANINGDATQKFKVADAVNADEAASKGQLLNEIEKVESKNVFQGTAPSNPVEDMRWFDTKNDVIKIYKNGKWVQFNSAREACMSQEQFEALAEQRRQYYAGSGYINHSIGWWTNIDGISTVPNRNYQQLRWGTNTFYIGSETKNNVGHPTFNVNGTFIRLSYINESDRNITNRILFPQAPTGSKPSSVDITDEERRKNFFFISDLYDSSNDPKANAKYKVGDRILHENNKMYECIQDDPSGDHLLTNNEYYKELDSPILSRQDLVFLETWHELVEEKDIVYPYGNVQYNGADTDGLSGIANGTFAGADTYSLFGNWQNPGDLVGKGYKWSNLSEEDKIKFVSNPENNVYLTKDGYVQVRYRIRVVEGLGDEWECVVPNLHGDLSVGYDNYDYEHWIARKTYRTSIDSEYCEGDPAKGWRSADYHDHNVSNAGALGVFAPCCKDAQNEFTIPIALVQRRNQGVFHPVYNPEGTGSHFFGSAFYNPSTNELDLKRFIPYNSITTFEYNASGGYNDKPYIKYQRSSKLDSEGGIALTNFGGLVPGKEYKISFYYKVDGSNDNNNGEALITTTNCANAYNNRTVLFNQNLNNVSDWTKVTMTFTAAEDKNHHIWIFRECNADNTFSISNLVVENITVPEIDSIIDTFNENVLSKASIGSVVSGRPDNLYYEEINERDVEDLRMSAWKITDKYSYLEEWFKKAIGGQIRGKESSKTIKTAYIQKLYTASEGQNYVRWVWNSLTTTRYYRLPQLSTTGLGTLAAIEVAGVILQDGTLLASTGKYYYDGSYGSAGIYIKKPLTSEQAQSINDNGFTVIGVNKTETHTQNNTALVCDIIGDPRTLAERVEYRTTTGDDQTAVIRKGTWVKADDTYYRSKVDRGDTAITIDPDTEDYTNTTNWDNRGTDGSIGGYPLEWKQHGIFGTPLITRDTGESLLLEDLSINTDTRNNETAYGVYIKLSRLIKKIRKVVFYNTKTGEKFESFYGENSTGHQTFWYALYHNQQCCYYYDVYNSYNTGLNNQLAVVIDGTVNNNSSILKKDPNDDNYYGNYLIQVFYDTYADFTTPVENSKVESLKNVYANFDKLLNSLLINKIPEANWCTGGVSGCASHSSEVPLVHKSIGDMLYTGYKATLKHMPLLDLLRHHQNTPVCKKLPYLTQQNSRAQMNIVFKEIKWTDGDGWGDDDKFQITNNVSTTTDDNGQTILYGQKAIKLPNFLVD